ncbi:methyltransferase domain-containing protein [Nonomuraea antri]|uniref:methyltransferase domain-containing protein n=1 Tax=Nonomuraea antri TaxID=2730852 RepID=UPI0038B2FC7A
MATTPGASADARHLPVPDESADAVLLLGPLCHLAERADRVEARRAAVEEAGFRHCGYEWRHCPACPVAVHQPQRTTGHACARDMK